MLVWNRRRSKHYFAITLFSVSSSSQLSPDLILKVLFLSMKCIIAYQILRFHLFLSPISQLLLLAISLFVDNLIANNPELFIQI